MASIVDDRGYNQGFAWTPAQDVRMRRRAQAIAGELALHHDDRILELGCGTGELSHLLSECTAGHVFGVDLCGPFVDQATRNFGNERVSYVQADISTEEGIDKVGRGYAAVVGNGILHHLYFRIDEALRRIRRVLAANGRIVFWEPNLFNPYVYAIFKIGRLRRWAKLEPDEMAFTPRWIEAHLRAAGYVDIRVDYRDFLVPVVPARLIDIVARVGDAAEKMPVVNRLTQSLFVCATSPTASGSD